MVPLVQQSNRGEELRAQFCAAQLELFDQRCRTLAERVRAGDLGFLDAVDLAASAVEWSGLAKSIGWDACQSVMSRAFMGAPRREAA